MSGAIADLQVDRGPAWAGNRQLDHYPSTQARRLYLLLVVAITVSLYYALYVGGAVATLLMPEYGMSFATFVEVLAAANLVGAFASLLAGISDRVGRARLVVWGLLLVGLLTLFGIPLSTTKVEWAIATVLTGFVEGIILVATPALMRDFSPQVGRGAAMGFWAMGPVLGSLLVSVVASSTMSETTPWRSQYEICGAVVLGAFVLALLFLKELRPEIRDQLMVSERDRRLIEWRARTIDVSARIASPFRQLMHFDIIGSALAVSLLLLFYYTAVAFGTVYTVTLFGFSIERANALANWAWGTNVFALLFFGSLSDRLRVRKPFMLAGSLGSLVLTLLYVGQIGQIASFGTLAVITSVQAAFTACAYATWMAAFTETVEARNPALTATGLAIWGWILRLVVTAAFLILPVIVRSATAMVEAPIYVAKMQAALDAHQDPPAEVLRQLDLIHAATETAPAQWQTWFWICTAGTAVFLVLVFFMRGRWSPAAALADEQAHDAQIAAEIAEMERATFVAAPGRVLGRGAVGAVEVVRPPALPQALSGPAVALLLAAGTGLVVLIALATRGERTPVGGDVSG